MTTDLPTPAKPLRIGTRGSPLALAQARETRARLMAAFDLPEDAFEIVVIKTTGDDRSLIDADVALKTLGGKGLFTKEIEEDMLSGKIDIAVHSMKDMPVLQPEGLMLDCYLPREDVRDAFVSLHHGAGRPAPGRKGRVLVPAPARAAEGAEARSGGRGVPRQRADADEEAGRRGGRRDLPRHGGAEAAGHDGGGEIRDRAGGCAARRGAGRHRDRTPHRGYARAAMLEAIHHGPTGQRLAAERAFLAGLDGSCETPIAGLAELDGGTLRLRGEILRPDGSEVLTDDRTAPVEDGAKLGAEMARALRARAGEGFFDWIAA
jgi:hydroxymethylbilane synthase